MAFAQRHPTCERVPMTDRSRRLSPARQKKLLQLAQREDCNSRYDRIKCCLMRRIQREHKGLKLQGRAAQHVLHEYVSKIVADSSFKLQGKDLSNGSKERLAPLERQLLEQLQALGDMDLQHTSTTGPSSNLGPGAAADAANSSQTRGGGNQLPLDEVDTWQLLNVYQQFAAVEDQKKQRALKAQKTAQYRADLQKQIEEHEAIKKQQMAEIEVAREHNKRLIETFKEQQERVRKEIEEKHVAEKDRTLAILQDKKRREAEARKAQLAAEQSLIQRERRMIEEEEQRAREAKVMEKRKQEKIKEENERQREIRRLIVEAEARDDLRLMEEYKRKLEREEVERKQAFNNRVKKMAKLGQKWAEEGAGRHQMEVQLLQERAVMEAATAKEKEDQERERRDQYNKRMAKKRMAEENLLMSERHAEEAKAARESELKQIMKYREEDAQKRAREMEQRMRQRIKQKEYLELLRRQADTDRKLRRAPDVTQKEKLINKQLLTQAEKDQGFLDYMKSHVLQQLPRRHD